MGVHAGFLGEAANSVGGYVARAVPSGSGLNAAAMLKDSRQAYVVLGAEPELDCADGALALAALKKSAVTVVLTPFKSPAMLDYAAVLLLAQLVLGFALLAVIVRRPEQIVAAGDAGDVRRTSWSRW